MLIVSMCDGRCVFVKRALYSMQQIQFMSWVGEEWLVTENISNSYNVLHKYFWKDTES